MTRTDVQQTHTVNVLLAFVEHAPNRYRELQDELTKLQKRELVIRDEMRRLKEHAAIEQIDLTVEAKPEPPADEASRPTPGPTA